MRQLASLTQVNLLTFISKSACLSYYTRCAYALFGTLNVAVCVVRVANSLVADAAVVIATAVDVRILLAGVHSLDR